jgi:hypothetical protein
MPEKSEMEFSFKSAGLSGDPLNVTGFEGRKRLPAVCIQIALFSGDPAIDRRESQRRLRPFPD